MSFNALFTKDAPVIFAFHNNRWLIHTIVHGRSKMADDKGWLAECYRKKDAVLASILPDLDKSGSKNAMKYTFGQGNNGLHREAYCAAWIVMGNLLDTGRTFPELARIPESRMVGTIKDAMLPK